MNIKLKAALAVGAVSMVAAGSAAAQTAGVDVTAATAGFTGVTDAVNDIGPLMLGAAAAGIIYKWVTAFLI